MLHCVSLVRLPRAITVIKWPAKDWKTSVHFPASVGWTRHYHFTELVTAILRNSSLPFYWTRHYHFTELVTANELNSSLPLYWTRHCHCTELVTTIELNSSLPLNWTRHYHCTELFTAIVLNSSLPSNWTRQYQWTELVTTIVLNSSLPLYWTRHYHCTQICSTAQSHVKGMWDWSVAHKPPDLTLITHSHGKIYGHQLTPWSKVLLKTLTVPQLANKFPAFYGTRRFTTVLTTASHLSLSWGRWVESMPSAFYNLHFNIILLSMITSHKWSLFHRFPHQNTVYSNSLP